MQVTIRLRYGRHQLTGTLPILAVILALSRLAVAQKTSVDFDKATDFSKFKSYAWAKGSPTADPIVDAYIVTTAEDLLGKKGLVKTEPASANLLLAYHAVTDSDLDIGVFSDPTYITTGGMALPGQTVWAGGAGSSGRIVRKGSLAFQLWDRNAHKLVWTGSAAGTLKDKRSLVVDQVYKVMVKLFDAYPPGKT